MGRWVSSLHSAEAKQVSAPHRLRDGVSAWVSLVAGWLAVSLLTLLGATAAADRWLMDIAGAASGAAPPVEDVQVVAIDPASFQDLGVAWPWPRTIHADLVDAATRAGARAVVFDIVFDAQTGADTAFAGAIARSGRVTLAAERAHTETSRAVLETYAPPTPVLAEAAAAVGVAGLPIDGDGRLRRMPQDADALAYETVRTLGLQPSAPRHGRDRYIRFRGAGGLAAPVSYYQALEPDRMLAPGALTDKILLVGLALPASADATSFVGDEVLTPAYAGAARTGVDAQAEVLASVLAGDARVQSPLWVRIALLLIAFGASLYIVRLAGRRLPFATIFAAASLIAIPLIVILAWRAGWALEAGAAMLGMALSVLPRILHTGAHAFIQRRRLESRFAKYVSPEILTQLRHHPTGPELGGEERDVSIIVTDLAGYTRFMEGQGAAEGAAIMRDYLDRLAGVVLAHGGMIDQYIGDSIVAIFNAPLDQPDHAQRALACVSELERVGGQMSAELTGDGVEFGRTRIGGHCGRALVGNFGSRDRFHYTAMGDVVNLAARLEAACKHIGVCTLVSDDLYQAAGRAPEFLPVGPLRVEGRQAPIMAFTSAADRSQDAASVYRQAYELVAKGDAAAMQIATRLAVAETNDPLMLRLRRRLEAGVASEGEAVGKA